MRSDSGERQAIESDQFAWSLFVLLAAVLYLVLELFEGIDSPLFGLAIVVLMARELARSRRRPSTIQPLTDQNTPNRVW